MNFADTIFAVSSGAGLSGVSVIRVSGPKAMHAGAKIAGQLPGERMASLRRFRAPESGEVIDEGIVIPFPGPGSFTGEDVCEFHIHGGLAVQRAMLDVLTSLPGLRAAEAGEFTRRAVRNGRMDLVGAEGLSDLIHARTERQRRQALHHTLGKASGLIDQWRQRLVGVLGRIEAAVDFTEEPGVAEQALAGIEQPLKELISEMRSALADAKRGAVIREGVRVVLAGPPNVGKSSLLNALARRDAAIVSAIPGTTRDVIEVAIELAGVPVILSDTAGLHEEARDEIELAGMERTRRELGEADIVVWITAADEARRERPRGIDSDAIWIMNKVDLVDERWEGPMHWISALTCVGVAEFLDGLEARVTTICGSTEPATLIRARHDSAMQKCVADLEGALDSAPERIEIVAEKLRGAAFALGTLTGAIGVEDVLDSIFREFCIGK
jgi:tRNA modification GTPase